jgi:O-antigen/teichoic acid export membrane protein
MASKMIMSLQSIIISANRVIIPFIAQKNEKTPWELKKIYKYNFDLMLFISAPYYAMIIVAIPAISIIWLGRIENIFIYCAWIFASGAFINTLSAPAYFAYLGIGRLRWVTIAHIAIASLNVLLGVIFGFLFNEMGVIVSWAIAIIIGSLFQAYMYHRELNFSILDTIDYPHCRLFIFIILGLLSSILVYFNPIPVLSDLQNSMIEIFTYCIIVIIPFWIHPLRKIVMKTLQLEKFSN